ncbi:lactadherin-like [Actinia tenebrosa]|uniref:Lactadherin-like n=1 Tax=Actinia tenebrosa TaxID=6105 RepID=A0A6P8ITJ9_ACTTE|nr:lactadherin-like [Actinia tenebrosa]
MINRVVWPATFLILVLPWRYSHASCGESEYTQPGHVLINHVIESLMGTSLMGCMQHCDENVFCSSINIYTDSRLCELNSANHISFPEDLVPVSHHASYMIYSLHPAFVCSNHRCPDPDTRCFLYGTSRHCHVCVNPLGMEDGRITDAQITASSFFRENHVPANGRLGNTVGAGAWAAKKNLVGEYLQIDLGKAMIIIKVATQARHRYPYFQWVTKYYLTYSMGPGYWLPYKYYNQVKEFQGNHNRDIVVTNSLPLPLKTRYIRIVVLEWNNHISMRAELYGCSPP